MAAKKAPKSKSKPQSSDAAIISHDGGRIVLNASVLAERLPEIAQASAAVQKSRQQHIVRGGGGADVLIDLQALCRACESGGQVTIDAIDWGDSR